MGKTTILKCLYHVLDGSIEKLNDIIFDDVSLFFSDNTKFSISHREISIYADYVDYMDSLVPSRKRMLQLKGLFSAKELDQIRKLIEDSNEIELKKYWIRVIDKCGIPLSIARRELERYILLEYKKNTTSNGEFDEIIEKVMKFKKSISEKIEGEILYFPTYRRIEANISNLGVGIKDNNVRNEHIQFGMADVEENIEKLLQKIKSVAIDSFAKMTGILLKQYLDDKLFNLENYEIEQNKLEIALERIGAEIEKDDKNRIIELVNNSHIYEGRNKYLLHLIKNLIDSYEKQNEYDNRIKTFLKICNAYLNSKKYVYDESKVKLEIQKDKTKELVSIHNLSSGEKQIISVFSKLYIENIKNCIILFDEPELSLSIIWQRMFLPDIVASEKCSTLIAVTHSPYIFENEFDDIAKYMGDYLKENEEV